MKKAEYDKYYTPNSTIYECVEFMGRYIDEAPVIMDPCAGDGRWNPALRAVFSGSQIKFFDLIPDTGSVCVEKMDFLTEACDLRPNVIVSNPPFGKGNSLSHKIFNRAATFYKPDYICFLVPKSFGKRKTSLRSISLDYSMLAEMEIPRLHFERIDGVKYDSNSSGMRCCFQIWERLRREEIPPFVWDSAPNEKLKFKRSALGFTLFHPAVNKWIDLDGRSHEYPVGTQQFVEKDVDISKLVTLTTHGKKAGQFKPFEPDTDKTTVRQFILADAEVRAHLEGCDFSEYLSAAGFEHNPSISSEEIFECLEKHLASAEGLFDKEPSFA